MAHVAIQKLKLESAYRYGNLIRNKAKRDYAFAYIAWLKNGAEGLEPDKGKLSSMGAQAVRMTIDAMKLWIVDEYAQQASLKREPTYAELAARIAELETRKTQEEL